MMSNTASFTLNIGNIIKKARDKMGLVLSVSVVVVVFHAYTWNLSSFPCSIATSSGIHGEQTTYKLF